MSAGIGAKELAFQESYELAFQERKQLQNDKGIKVMPVYSHIKANGHQGKER